MLRLDSQGRPYHSTELNLHGVDVKREIGLVADREGGTALKSIESLMRDEALEKARLVGEYEQKRRFYEKEMMKEMKRRLKNAQAQKMAIKEQLRVKKTLSGAECAALSYQKEAMQPRTFSGANFQMLDVVPSSVTVIDPRQPKTDFDKIMNGEFIGQPVGTPIVGYDPVSQGASCPQMGGFMSDLFDKFGLKKEYQAVRDAVKGEIKKEVTVVNGIEYIKDAAGNWINKQTGQILNKPPTPTPTTTTQANMVTVPGIGNVDKKWLYIGGGVFLLGVLAIFLRRK
jgi:hypothetical protein